MPVELYSREDFIRVAVNASELRVKIYEDEGYAKIKARTRRYLYTYKAKLDEVDSIINEVKSKVPEIEVVYY